MTCPPDRSRSATRVKCLIVDDLQENLLALSALLREEDVEVLSASSGAHALELLLVHDDIALAFLDVQMPQMDGFELAELIRGSERTRHIPLIFVTAAVSDHQRLFRGYESGAVDFLYKPIDPHILRSKAGVFFDLYRVRQQLAQELKERTETLRLNETFAAVLGHDLRGPLSAIMMSAMVMQRRATDDAVRDTAGKIVVSSKWMSRMIYNTLDLSRARLGGGIPIAPADADAGTLVDQVLEECRAASPEAVIQASTTGDLCGHWDADRLCQVFSNLLGNAMQHGASGAPIVVELDGTAADGIAFTVTNKGAIPAHLLPQLFEPFKSKSHYESGHKGLGLGLYIVREIARAHGGTIEVLAPGDGYTSFRVQLPRRAAAPGPAPAALAGGGAGPSSGEN